jgi:hypothetical protein
LGLDIKFAELILHNKQDKDLRARVGRREILLVLKPGEAAGIVAASKGLHPKIIVGYAADQLEVSIINEDNYWVGDKNQVGKDGELAIADLGTFALWDRELDGID